MSKLARYPQIHFVFDRTWERSASPLVFVSLALPCACVRGFLSRAVAFPCCELPFSCALWRCCSCLLSASSGPTVLDECSSQFVVFLIPLIACRRGAIRVVAVHVRAAGAGGDPADLGPVGRHQQPGP